MAMRDQTIPLFKVWNHDDGETEADAREWGALNTEAAARLHAEHYHAHRDGWERKWPLEFRVKAPNGAVLDVEIHREMVPEFVVGKAVLVKRKGGRLMR